MLACENELKCIEIASPIIKKYALIKVNKLKEQYSLIFNTHRYLNTASLDEGLICDKRKLFWSFLYLLFDPFLRQVANFYCFSLK